MKIETVRGKVFIIKYRQDNTDKDYGSCLWADFYIDEENSTLMVVSDCGNYVHRWPSEPGGFAKQLAGMKSDYLLEKFNAPRVIDETRTYEELKEYLLDSVFDFYGTEDSEFFDSYLEEFLEDVQDAVDSAEGEFELYERIDTLLRNVQYTDLSEYYTADENGFPDGFQNLGYEDFLTSFIKRYSYDAIKIGEIFEKFVVPELSKIANIGVVVC